jgi:TRAP-type C4-dicarboxylate transport system permease small subunit
MQRAIDIASRLIEGVIAACLAAMVVMVFGNVVLRYGFNSGITVSEELSRWLFLWMTFLGAVLALKEHGHLGSDTLVSRLPKGGKRFCLVVGQLLMLYITWLVFQGSLAQTRINWDAAAPVTGLPLSVVYATGVVFAVFTAIILLRETWRALTGKLSEAEMVMVKEEEG